MTALVDTCIVIDALANRVPFAKDAQELLIRGTEKQITLLLSCKSFIDLRYVLKHSLHDENIVRSKLSALLRSLVLVDTEAQACANALRSPTTDYEDAVQIETALFQGADYIVTRDKPGYSASPIPHVMAGEMLKIIGYTDTNS